MHRGSTSRPGLSLQYSILEAQGFGCAYCTFPFGTLVRTARGEHLTTLEWDHFVPLSLLVRNEESNWVAACGLCNNIKHSHVFETLTEARDAVLTRWAEKQHVVLWVPSTSSEQDIDAWHAEYEGREEVFVDRSTTSPLPRRVMRFPKTCEECRSVFDDTHNRPNRRFCSRACSDKFYNRKRMRDCARCGKTFLPMTQGQKICCESRHPRPRKKKTAAVPRHEG